MCQQQYVLVYQESLFETAWPACDTQKVDVPWIVPKPSSSSVENPYEMKTHILFLAACRLDFSFCWTHMKHTTESLCSSQWSQGKSVNHFAWNERFCLSDVFLGKVKFVGWNGFVISRWMSIEDWLGDGECSASSGWVGTMGLCGCSTVDFVVWISVNLSTVGWQDFLHASFKKKN